MAAANPESVAIVAMGDSSANYLNVAACAGGRKALYQEVWAIVAMGGVIQHDRAFLMTGLHALEATAAAGTEKSAYVASILRWARTHPGPLYTPEHVAEYPGSVAYPLVDVLTTLKWAHFNTSIAYAIGLAIHLRVKRIGLYGCDFTYPDQHAGEAGHACAAYLIGRATALGIAVVVPVGSTLMDSHVEPGKQFYGYTTPPDMPEPLAAMCGLQTRASSNGHVETPAPIEPTAAAAAAVLGE